MKLYACVSGTWQFSVNVHEFTFLFGILSTLQEAPRGRITSLYIGPIRITVTRWDHVA